jgi:hypothetical protein
MLRAYLISVVVMQGGDKLCQTTCATSISIRQLKAKAEVGGGLKAVTLAIYLPEVAQPLGQNDTLADCGLPSILIALTLHKITIADMLHVSPGELADAQLAQPSKPALQMRAKLATLSILQDVLLSRIQVALSG